VAGAVILLAFRATSANLGARGVASGFQFLQQVARVPVSNASIPFESGVDSYGRALLVGVANTIKISAVAIALATVLGIIVGAGRLSLNPLIRRLCGAYVDLMRNVPVVLHILVWYTVLLALPGPADAMHVGDWLVLSNRGLFLPGWVLEAGRLVFAPPHVDGLEIVAGTSMSPEYAALLTGITTYAAAFVAEIVRGAILAVPKGQWEGGYAIGLRRGVIFRRIVFPQAARSALPPLTSEYLGIVKNSSLAVAIGYQDLVGVGNSVLFETGQAVEVMAIIVFFYIAVSLLVSLVMELAGRSAALRQR
jgi:general L-amino acid transport system permease protein